MVMTEDYLRAYWNSSVFFPDLGIIKGIKEGRPEYTHYKKGDFIYVWNENEKQPRKIYITSLGIESIESSQYQIFLVERLLSLKEKEERLIEVLGKKKMKMIYKVSETKIKKLIEKTLDEIITQEDTQLYYDSETGVRKGRGYIGQTSVFPPLGGVIFLEENFQASGEEKKCLRAITNISSKT